MHTEKTKIRVRIRKSRTGDPYSDVSFEAPRSMMYSAKQSSFWQKPAVRAGLLIGAAVVALVAAALIAKPFAPKESEVSGPPDTADALPLPAADGAQAARSASEESSSPSSTNFVYQDDEASRPAIEPAAPAISDAEQSAAGQMPAAPPTLEALQAEETPRAAALSDAEGVAADHDFRSAPQTPQPTSPESEPLITGQPNDVFAPEPSVTPGPPAFVNTATRRP